MKSGSSLRTRLIVGSVLWMGGVLVIGSIVVTHLVSHNPGLVGFAHNAMFTLFAFASVVVGLAQLRRGLSPFQQLRERLAAVRDGRDRRLQGTYPSEVEPLVQDLNGLLDQREQAVARAVAKAGDLAHGLKTPLAVLAQEAERAEAAGHHDLAATIGEEVERMRRQIEYHLAHARAAASGGSSATRVSVAESAEGLARAQRRLHAERALTIDVTVPADIMVRVARPDLDEMIGNLLDNACTWARRRVTVGACLRDDVVVIAIDDDGPGLDPAQWERVLQRGVRADEAAPGSGLGLAIVRDLAEVYGGSITLGRSAIGGLSAQLALKH